MTESLKAQRRDLAADLDCTEDCLRELQKQAMELAIRRVAAVQIKHGLGGLHVEAYSAVELDWLLDEPPPAFPVRCIHCGKIDEAHALCAHVFQPQSPRCHRAHPHSEPCGPGGEGVIPVTSGGTIMGIGSMSAECPRCGAPSQFQVGRVTYCTAHELEERHRQEAAEARGWSGVEGGGDE